MRLRIGVSCVTLTCSGVAVTLVSAGSGCFGSSLHVQYDSGTFDGTTADVAFPLPEGASPEAGLDAAPDAAPEAEAGCAPGSVQGFTAPPYVPVVGTSSDCFGFRDAAATLATDCFGDAATFQACAADTDASLPDGSTFGTCQQCLVTPENGDAGYGAAIQATIAVANLAGCVERSDSTDAGFGCAAAIQTAWQCADYACAPSCPVVDDPSRTAYIACTRAAAASVCSAYAAAANACLGVETDMGDTGVATNVTLNCLNDAGQLGDPVANMLLYFCGS